MLAQQTPGGGDLHVTLRFADGSLGDRHLRDRRGQPASPRRRSTSSGGGRNARLDNFTRATVWRRDGKDAKRALGGQDKGQRPELAAFVEAVRTAVADADRRCESLVATTRATIAVGTSLRPAGG